MKFFEWLFPSSSTDPTAPNPNRKFVLIGAGVLALFLVTGIFGKAYYSKLLDTYSKKIEELNKDNTIYQESQLKLSQENKALRENIKKYQTHKTWYPNGLAKSEDISGEETTTQLFQSIAESQQFVADLQEENFSLKSQLEKTSHSLVEKRYPFRVGPSANIEGADLKPKLGFTGSYDVFVVPILDVPFAAFITYIPKL